MQPSRRRLLHLASGAAAIPVLTRMASARSYPPGPVRLIAGFPQGGIVDAVARLMGKWLTRYFGTPFVVENQPGASSNIATRAVAQSAPDGTTLLLMSANNAYNATLYKAVDFDFMRDIAPVARIGRVPFVMEVGPTFPTRTVSDFIALAKENPGKIRMATAGSGSAQHIYGELFKMLAGVDLATKHYGGAGAAFPDLETGNVDVLFDPVASSIGLLGAGRLSPLAVTTATPTAVLPGVPPLGGFVPGYEATGWNGIGAPARTPLPIIEFLNTSANAALADPAFQAQLSAAGVEPFATSTSAFGHFIEEDIARWARVIRSAGIEPG